MKVRSKLLCEATAGLKQAVVTFLRPLYLKLMSNLAERQTSAEGMLGE